MKKKIVRRCAAVAACLVCATTALTPVNVLAASEVVADTSKITFTYDVHWSFTFPGCGYHCDSHNCYDSCAFS